MYETILPPMLPWSTTLVTKPSEFVTKSDLQTEFVRHLRVTSQDFFGPIKSAGRFNDE